MSDIKKRFIPVVAYDDGYGQEKLFTEIGPENTTQRLFKALAYPSLIVEIESSRLSQNLSIFNRKSRDKDDMFNDLTIEHKGVKYAVGSRALEIKPSLASKDLQMTKFRDITSTLKFLAGLTYLLPDYDVIEIGELALGLSLQAFNKESEIMPGKLLSEEIESQYKDSEFDFAFKSINGQMKQVTVQIHRCSCTEQGVGALCDLFFDLLPDGQIVGNTEFRNFENKRFGIDDMGHQTNDHLRCKGIKPVEGSEIFNNKGLFNAFSTLSKSFNNCPPSVVEQYFVTAIDPKILAHKKEATLYWDNKEYAQKEVIEECYRVLDRHGDQIINEVETAWKNDIPSLQFMLLCGGGAYFFKEKFEKAFNTTILLSKDPHFANVKGFYKARRFVYNQLMLSSKFDQFYGIQR